MGCTVKMDDETRKNLLSGFSTGRMLSETALGKALSAMEGLKEQQNQFANMVQMNEPLKIGPLPHVSLLNELVQKAKESQEFEKEQIEALKAISNGLNNLNESQNKMALETTAALEKQTRETSKSRWLETTITGILSGVISGAVILLIQQWTTDHSSVTDFGGSVSQIVNTLKLFP